ncbi:MAG: hypothetical protein UFN42_06295 [Collinsella sp.]|nr:hypothetical protein [Collinsella sp.]
MNEIEINNILSKGANLLDITPSMFEEATSHYKAVGEFLGNHGIDADISPCGSILTGTVVRPYSENEDAYFDIDVLVNRPGLTAQTTHPGKSETPSMRPSSKATGTATWRKNTTSASPLNT